MAVIKVGNNSIGKISVIEPYDDPVGTPPAEYKPDLEPWVRPSEWLDMPVINSGDNKIAMLLFMNSGVPLEIRITIRGTDNGAYNYPTYSTIDWGDGTSVLVSGRDTRSTSSEYLYPRHHSYRYEDLPEGSEFIHNGQVARQALVQIDNSVSGCYYFDFIGTPNPLESNVRDNAHNNLSVYQNAHTTLLDLHIASQNLEYAYFSLNRDYCQNLNLERVIIDTPHKLKSAYRLFRDCSNLKVVSYPSGAFSDVTDFSEMFSRCRKLKEIPYFDSSNATSFNSTFYGCRSIKNIPELITHSVTGFNSSFGDCLNLTGVPLIDYSSAIQTQSTFSRCLSIKTIPSGLNLQNVTHSNSMFSQCFGLQACPDDFFDQFSNLQQAQGMFYECRSLKKLPRINLPNCVNMREFATVCSSIEKIHLGDISKVDYHESYGFYNAFGGCGNVKEIIFDYPENIIARNMQSMFSGLTNLRKIPYFNTSSGVFLQSLFQGARSVTETPTFDLTSCQRIDNMFNGNHSLVKSGGFKNIKTKLISAANTFRDCYHLREFPSGMFQDYNSAPSYPQSFIYNCFNLEEIPDINISGLDSTSTSVSPFSNISSLERVGHITFGSGANCRSMFQNVNNLDYIGSGDMSLVYDCTNMFNSSRALRWCDLRNIPKTISFYDNFLGSGALTHIFNNLVSGVTGQTIDIRNNYGTAELHSDTIAIATSKGWTVTT